MSNLHTINHKVHPFPAHIDQIFHLNPRGKNLAFVKSFVRVCMIGDIFTRSPENRKTVLWKTYVSRKYVFLK